MIESAVALNLVVIRTTDLEAASRFYSALGLEFSKERHGTGPEHLVARLGPLVFEIYPASGGASFTGIRLGFIVPSVHAAVLAAEAAGGKVVSPPREGLDGVGAVVMDPDGHKVEIALVSSGNRRAE
jgi:catechol 2,3-dioxygenase-like lactoylglutathione lyase family enzyme